MLEDDFDNVVIPSRPISTSGMVFTATQCPKCGKDSVFPTTVIIEVDGRKYGPVAMKCNKCGWQTPKEEIEQWVRKYMME